MNVFQEIDLKRFIQRCYMWIQSETKNLKTTKLNHFQILKELITKIKIYRSMKWLLNGRIAPSLKSNVKYFKSEKYHIKTLGYVTLMQDRLVIYWPGGQSEKIFVYLLRPLGSSHHAFADKYYTTHSLIYQQREIIIQVLWCQTVKISLMKLKKTKVKHMESKFYRSREEILLCMWKDKKSKKKSRCCIN